MQMETTRRLASFAASTSYEDLPVSVQQFCKLLLLDFFACCMAGHESQETAQIRILAERLAKSNESTVIGGAPMSLAGATLVNGYLSTAVTMCDMHRPTFTHVSPEVIPPALLICERDGLDGKALLRAIAVGCEVTVRVGLGLDPAAFRRRGWHGPGVIGPFGGAAAVGALIGLDAGAMARAFGLAGSQAAGTFAAWGTPTVKFHQCRGALSGLMAALLAEQGFVATEQILTAADGGLFHSYADGGIPGAAEAQLGQHWELEQIALRLWPSGTSIQGLITAMFDLVSSQPIRPDEIRTIRVYLSRQSFDMHGRFARYNGRFEALLSAHYAAAVILHHRDLSLSMFGPSYVADQRLSSFAAEKIEALADPELDGPQARLEAELQDGRTFTITCLHPKGAPENPLSWSDVEAKFRQYARDRIPASAMGRIIEIVASLDAVGSTSKWLPMLASGHPSHMLIGARD